VLTSEAGSSVDLLKALDKDDSFFTAAAPWKASFIENFSNVIGERNRKEQITALLETVAKPGEWQSVAVRGLIKGQEKAKGVDEDQLKQLKSIAEESGNNITKAIQDLKQLYK
jgi:hypothetical protein